MNIKLHKCKIATQSHIGYRTQPNSAYWPAQPKQPEVRKIVAACAVADTAHDRILALDFWP